MNSSASFTSPPAAPWQPDAGDGAYRNPVLFADYSDPDAVRVGEDYWLTSSSFGHVPGLPILHSRDLVNWSLVNHALPRLVPEAHFARPRHGCGVWAPSIRYHAAKYWIYYPDPDFGLYAITADDPRGRWSDPVLVLAGKGLIDPCPLWEPDGTGYLVHAWARSRSGIKNRLTLHRLRPDHLGVADAGTVIIDGDRLPGWNTIEGPKLYRRGDYIYLFAPAGGVTEGYQAVFRSRAPFGPYEHRIVLAQGATAVNGPHQGAWVDTPEGGHAFLHFQERPAYGRIVHLQPMRWVDDWPVMGHAADPQRPGEPVLVAPLPRRIGARPAVPATTDEFELPHLGLQWQWQANPVAGAASLTAREGFLRLTCQARDSAPSLWDAAHLLMQKFPAEEFLVSTVLDFASARAGETAGLIVFGFSYAWIGLRREDAGVVLVLRRCDDAHQGGVEREELRLPMEQGPMHLRVRVTAGARCEFAYSPDGNRFTAVGEPFPARSSYWVGAKVGLFAAADGPSISAPGHADFDWFRVGPLSG